MNNVSKSYPFCATFFKFAHAKLQKNIYITKKN